MVKPRETVAINEKLAENIVALENDQSFASVYIELEHGFSENSPLLFYRDACAGRIIIDLHLPEGVKSVRVDLVEGVVCALRNLKVRTSNGMIMPSHLNGIIADEFIVFTTMNPQIKFDFTGEQVGWLRLEAEYYVTQKETPEALIQQAMYDKIIQMERSHMEVIGSRSWKFTRPFRSILGWVKRIMNANCLTRLLLAGIISLKNDGIYNTWNKTLLTLKRKLQKNNQDVDEVPFLMINGQEPATKCPKRLFDKKIAIQIHLFYLDEIGSIIETVNHIPYPYDCYISTDTVSKAKEIEVEFKRSSNAENVVVEVFPNRGRDMAPFLRQMVNRIHLYDYIAHIHSKKTSYAQYGSTWKDYLYRNLLDSSMFIMKILDLFENNASLGIIYPETYPVVGKLSGWGGNRRGCEQILTDLGLQVTLNDVPVFPAGNMFWARTAAVRKMFEKGYRETDFPLEAGQDDGTLGHQIERLWVYVARAEGYTHQKIFNNCVPQISYSHKKRIIFYVHYESNNTIAQTDIDYLKQIKEFIDTIVFVTNSKLSEAVLEKIASMVTVIYQRENKDYDFGAWKHALSSFGFDNLEAFEQVILANNSCLAPVFSLSEMFAKMEREKVDFWGVTVHPYRNKGDYIGKSCIDEHLQSYFQVFNKTAFMNPVFYDFWQSLGYFENWKAAVAEGEVRMTKYLASAGLSYSYYVKESLFMPKLLLNDALMYETPTVYMLLRCPFLKKKAKFHMKDAEKKRLDDFIQNLNNASEA